jgi:hypothetical protein
MDGSECADASATDCDVIDTLSHRDEEGGKTNASTVEDEVAAEDDAPEEDDKDEDDDTDEDEEGEDDEDENDKRDSDIPTSSLLSAALF